MREAIKGKHLGKVISVDMRTGKETETKSSMLMLPAKEGTCEQCATAHEPEAPHNQQSLFYQMRFFNEHGRWPNWGDALKHCDKKLRLKWTKSLKEHGIKASMFIVKK